MMRRYGVPLAFLLAALTAVHFAPILCARCARERRELAQACELARDYLDRGETELAARVLDAAIDRRKRR